MKTLILTIVVMAASLAVAAGPAGAASSKGPYYPTPSWDQQLDCTKTHCSRFVVLSDWGGAAVLDLETGLVWEQSPSASPADWFGAQARCNSLTAGDRLGWRLPTLQELASLVDPTQSNPALPPGHPFSNVQSALASSTYWSATIAFPPTNSFAWTVSFVGLPSGFVGTSAFQSQSFFSWCVRGGQGANPQ